VFFLLFLSARFWLALALNDKLRMTTSAQSILGIVMLAPLGSSLFYFARKKLVVRYVQENFRRVLLQSCHKARLSRDADAGLRASVRRGHD
jgi:hypothetical protein